MNNLRMKNNQYYYELKGATKELERVENELRSNKENFKKELEENYTKLKHIMQDAAIKKEDTLKQSFKIVELMDSIREKEKIIDEKLDLVQELQEKERELNMELGNARGVIETLQNNISNVEKDREKECK